MYHISSTIIFQMIDIQFFDLTSVTCDKVEVYQQENEQRYDMLHFPGITLPLVWGPYGQYKRSISISTCKEFYLSLMSNLRYLRSCCPMCLHCGVSDLHPRVAAAAPVSPPRRGAAELAVSCAAPAPGTAELCRLLQQSTADCCTLLQNTASSSTMQRVWYF